MRRYLKDGQITLMPEPFGDAQAYTARADFLPLVMLTDKQELPPRVTGRELSPSCCAVAQRGPYTAISLGLSADTWRKRPHCGAMSTGASSSTAMAVGAHASCRYSLAMAIINCNGSDLPDALRPLPAGRYTVEAFDESPPLTADEEDGLILALDSLRAGRGVDHEDVRARVLKRIAP